METHSPIYSIHISDFSTDDRTRSQLGEIEDFANKLRDEGQQNPVTYEVMPDGSKRLNTGMRRFAAAGILLTKGEFIGMKLPEGNPRRVSEPGHVLARDIMTLDEIDRLTLELSENINRKGFTKSEEALGIAKLRKLLEVKTGKPVSISDLANKLRLSIGQVGMGMRVANQINNDPTSQLSKDLIKSPSIKAAYDKMISTKKLDDLKVRAGKTREVAAVRDTIAHADGIAFLKALPTESVDFINFDPPWGIGIDEYDRHHKHENFDDDPDYAWKYVIEPMVPELYRVLKQDTWSVAWFGIQFYERLKSLLERAKFTVKPVPNIWYKTNKGGSQNNPDLHELNVYEPFFVIKKGDPRLFKKPITNVLECPMDYGQERTHFAQKPLDLCIELLERYTYPGMHVVDPTYGVGKIFKAAQKLGRTIAGAEKNEKNRELCLLDLSKAD